MQVAVTRLKADGAAYEEAFRPGRAVGGVLFLQARPLGRWFLEPAVTVGDIAREVRAIGERVVAARREVAEKLVRTYCVAKGVAVAFNPVPVADLAAAALIDGGMVVHLSRVYNLPLTRGEAGSRGSARTRAQTSGLDRRC